MRIIVRFKNDKYPAATLDVWVTLTEFADEEALEAMKRLVLEPQDWAQEQP